MNKVNLRNFILSILGLIFVLYSFYWLTTGLLSTQLSTPWLVSLGLSSTTSIIITEIIFASIVGSIVCIPFGIITHFRPVICSFIASLIVAVFLIYENQIYLSWHHYFSYFLLILAAIVFTFIGSKLRKTPVSNK